MDDTGHAALVPLTLAAHQALQDDATAPAAMLYFERLPDHGGTLAWSGLDRILLDADRALHVRIAAAKLRPKDGRPDEVEALVFDPDTHPALRNALQ